MRRLTATFAVALMGSTALFAQDADMIINGNIYTGNEARPVAESVAVRDGRISCVGDATECASQRGPSTRMMSLGDHWMYPGFVDAHAHLAGIGNREITLNLDKVRSIEELKRAVSAWIDANPEQPVIVGMGWIETHWPEERFPTRWDLDEISPDVPVILSRADGHAVVANSKALEATGISGKTEVPFGGEILKNALGEPNGILVDTAIALVGPIMPRSDDDRLRTQITIGGQVMAASGWTGVHNMSVFYDTARLTETLSDAGLLKIRVHNSIVDNQADRLFENGPSASRNGRVETRAIKMYMDGALGSRGAALLEPYSDSPESTGLIVMKEEDSRHIMTRALKEGIQINTHGIGDRGNRQLLDWYEKTFAEVPVSDRKVAEPRWRIEHSQIIHPDDIPRFKAMGVIPSMQPSHAIGDLYFAVDRLGPDRMDGAYAWQSLLDSGVIIAGGSDAPVEQGKVMIEYYAAVARKGLDGYQDENWRPREAVSRADAIRMFTIWPAIAAFQERDLGTIEVGKMADFSVFDIDLMTVPEDEILNGKPVMTIVDGEVAFQIDE